MVPALITVNVLLFVVTEFEAVGLSRGGQSRDFDGVPLFQMLALRRDDVADGAWWQPLTSGFMHGGPTHLLLNMISLWMIGQGLEQVLGRARFLGLYLVSLLGGSLAVLLFANPSIPTVGASGAVFGLMAGLVVIMVRTKIDARPVLAVILLNVIISFLPGISYYAHFGGLLSGAATTAAMLYLPTPR